jgi:hypothetical protein
MKAEGRIAHPSSFCLHPSESVHRELNPDLRRGGPAGKPLHHGRFFLPENTEGRASRDTRPPDLPGERNWCHSTRARNGS